LKRMKVMTSVIAAGLMFGALVSGCGAKVEGGDTSCKDYMSANDADQQTAVSKMLKDEKGTDAAQLEVTGTKLSVQTFCQTAGKEDSKIKEAPHLENPSSRQPHVLVSARTGRVVGQCDVECCLSSGESIAEQVFLPMNGIRFSDEGNG
jgi:acid stress chaperone HdeA